MDYFGSVLLTPTSMNEEMVTTLFPVSYCKQMHIICCRLQKQCKLGYQTLHEQDGIYIGF